MILYLWGWTPSSSMEILSHLQVSVIMLDLVWKICVYHGVLGSDNKQKFNSAPLRGLWLLFQLQLLCLD